jgi:aryl-alcohol dehydrogenase-like predicted oxidoreductase
MQYRELGRTGWKVSEVSFGAWAIGASWGSVDDNESIAALNRAIALGVNFIDTADVYGDGHSEQLIAKVLKERRETVYVATKVGRRLSPHTADGYTAKPTVSTSCSYIVRRRQSTTARRCLARWMIWWRPAKFATTA